ncbi:MAG TPA: hypothetical protein VGQ57_09975 [Polyangiaceae bacterium]|nr:hypothetical protein [Polyangiaceae bacterium]
MGEDLERPELERTKPSVLLFDWTDDEVTVRWETVRRDRPPEPELEGVALPGEFRGIGPRAGSIALGMVLGISLAIGLLALFLPQTAPASPLPPSPPPWPMMTSDRAEFPGDDAPETALASMPLVKPEAARPAPAFEPAAAATTHSRRSHTLLNVDATQKSRVILDGRPLGATPQRVAVTPGAHVVVFVHPSEGRRTMTVDAAKDRVSFATARF